MSSESDKPLGIDPRDIEDPSGLVRLGLQFLRTGLPGGDLELQASILKSCSDVEISAAVAAAAAFEVNFVARKLAMNKDEVLQQMLEEVPDSFL